LIAFLGYINSPKWSKFKHNYNNYIIKNIIYKNQFNLIQKRFSSNLSCINLANISNTSNILNKFLKENNLNPAKCVGNILYDRGINYQTPETP